MSTAPPDADSLTTTGPDTRVDAPNAMDAVEQLRRNGTDADDRVKYVYFWADWHFLLWTVIVVVMLVWPWIFFGVVFGLGGVTMKGTASQTIHNNPQDTTWFATNIANLFTLITGFMFAYAVKALALKLLVTKTEDIFFISFCTAIRSPKDDGISWLISNRAWWSNNRRWNAFTMLIYAIAFFLITSAFNALITPQVITRTAPLQGTELDFSSPASDCISWYMNNLAGLNCNWGMYNGFWYTTCLDENQIVDVLESGRSNVASSVTSNNTVTFNQLDGVRFSGPIRGVLPIGPDGMFAFDTLQPSPVWDSEVRHAISYNYSLELQGVDMSVSCAYDTETPIKYYVAWPEVIWNGTCPDGADVLTFPAPPYAPPTYIAYIDPETPNVLGFWACAAPAVSGGLAYNLYFNGGGLYNDTIGNMTCQVSYAYPSTFSTSYSKDLGTFTASQLSSTPANVSGDFINETVRALGGLVSESQGLILNLVAESIITLGVKDFGVAPYSANSANLQIMENMIRGILEYEMTYSRVIYSSYNTPSNYDGAAPSSCMRTISGNVQYTLMGWKMTWHTALFLIPLTLASLTALGMLIATVVIGKRDERWRLPKFDPVKNPFDPLDPVAVLVAACRGRLQFAMKEPEPEKPDLLIPTTRVRHRMVRGISTLSNDLYDHDDSAEKVAQ